MCVGVQDFGSYRVLGYDIIFGRDLVRLEEGCLESQGMSQ